MTNDEKKQLVLVSIRECNERLKVLVEELGYHANVGGYRRIAKEILSHVVDVLALFKGRCEELQQCLRIEEEVQAKYE